jgi:hypothetical protein
MRRRVTGSHLSRVAKGIFESACLISLGWRQPDEVLCAPPAPPVAPTLGLTTEDARSLPSRRCQGRSEQLTAASDPRAVSL